MKFLSEKYDVLKELEPNSFMELAPTYIKDNIAHELRDYQKEAMGRYIYYKNNNRGASEHLLFNMATGSGKTLLMATLILEKYKQGSRVFIFFVNNTNILTKTKDNFLNSGSSKYLFSEKIIIDSKIVPIREINNLDDIQENAINILFTTLKNMEQLDKPSENKLSYDDFEGKNVTLIADEAHHLNAGLRKKEKDENKTWTDIVTKICNTVKEYSLFEFTATIDLSDKFIENKYKDKLIYKYGLKEFRLDGYSKDVLFHLVDNELEVRLLHAILISQYRKKVALNNGINLKPLIMFKSKETKDSANNLDLFISMMKDLTPEKIQRQKLATKEGILKQAFDYFDKINLSIDDLVQELKIDFTKERLMLIDGKTKTPEKLLLLNTLENQQNEIRAIFAVDLLNEGWDVLNLFDIVRLYDIRDGQTTKTGFKPGQTTNTEKQLIGRGARYYPFVCEGYEDKKYTRKYDSNELEELRVIEQLHYHSANNPRYISELKQVLRESGIYDDQNLIERELNLKNSFIETQTYMNGYVWVNKKMSKEDKFSQLSLFNEWQLNFPETIEVELPIHSVGDFSVFEGDDDVIYNSTNLIDKKQIQFILKDKISKNVIRRSINLNANHFSFKKLSKSYVGITSIDMFMRELGKVKVNLTGSTPDTDVLSQESKLFIVNKLLKTIVEDYLEKSEDFYGSENFEKIKLKNIFDKKIVRKYVINNQGTAESGLSQKDQSETQIFAEIDNLDWYVYDDNFGTSEEKYLVNAMSMIMPELEKKWDDIYLIRNEKGVRIYNFTDGKAFEPDFLLFANDRINGNLSWQIFIEPKGSQFLGDDETFISGGEGWKEKLLLEITDKNSKDILIDDDHYQIIGMPFYNEKITKNQFLEEMKQIGE